MENQNAIHFSEIRHDPGFTLLGDKSMSLASMEAIIPFLCQKNPTKSILNLQYIHNRQRCALFCMGLQFHKGRKAFRFDNNCRPKDTGHSLGYSAQPQLLYVIDEEKRTNE
jgi:hypothetical protein